MPIIIPMLRGVRTAELIKQHELLCTKNVENIINFAVHKKEREINDEINRRIRATNDALGMRGTNNRGCLYYEAGLEEGGAVVCEHVIPLTILVNLYRTKRRPFLELSLHPIARIRKESDKSLTQGGLARNGHDLTHPFKRYRQANPDLQIQTHQGCPVDLENWSMKDHWDLVFNTEELKDLLKEFDLEKPTSI